MRRIGLYYPYIHFRDESWLFSAEPGDTVHRPWHWPCPLTLECRTVSLFALMTSCYSFQGAAYQIAILSLVVGLLIGLPVFGSLMPQAAHRKQTEASAPGSSPTMPPMPLPVTQPTGTATAPNDALIMPSGSKAAPAEALAPTAAAPQTTAMSPRIATPTPVQAARQVGDWYWNQEHGGAQRFLGTDDRGTEKWSEVAD
jgi:hypothetical protein